jgi:hypothetical protein
MVISYAWMLARNAVRQTRISHERPLLEELHRQRSDIGIGDDLIVIPVHDQHRNVDLLEVPDEGLGAILHSDRAHG